MIGHVFSDEPEDAPRGIASPATLRAVSMRTSTGGGVYIVEYEVMTDMASAVARLIKEQIPLEIRWSPESHPGQTFVVGPMSQMKSSPMRQDADGVPRFILRLGLPTNAIPMGLGVLGAGITDSPLLGANGVLRLVPADS